MNRFLILALLLGLLHDSARAQEPLPPDILERLRKGEVILQEAQTDESGGAGRALALMHAEARAVWDVIISCDAAFIFVRGIKACEVLEDSGDRALVRQVVKNHWLAPAQDFVFESLRTPYQEMIFRRVEGDLDVMEGYWRFSPLDGGVLVDYQARIKPGMPAPDFLVRRTIRRDTPDLLACIRALSNGSGSEKARRADLDRCPN